MDCLNRISILKNPKIWIVDKYYSGIERFGSYLGAIVPSFIAVIGFLSSYKSLTAIDKISTPNQVLTSQVSLLRLSLVFLFVYGSINFVLIWALQKNELRIKRLKKNNQIFNENIVHVLQRYRVKKEKLLERKESLDSEYIETTIKEILKGVNNTYIKQIHRKDVSITLKYLANGVLHPIRIGIAHETRDQDPEEWEKAYVYKCLVEDGKKITFIYIKNIKNITACEMKYVGRYVNEIKSRAERYNYNSFIAIPLRGGKINLANGNGYKIEQYEDLGFIGLDLREKYGFGNFSYHEYFFLKNIADLLAEPIKDLIKTHKPILS